MREVISPGDKLFPLEIMISCMLSIISISLFSSTVGDQLLATIILPKHSECLVSLRCMRGWEGGLTCVSGHMFFFRSVESTFLT